jgi:DNA-directed RNA polymerase subunit H (RpoH/RPB5)
VLTILRAIVLAMSCLVALSAPAPADQWDDLAQKFIEQEHARLVRRAADKDDIVIVMEHRLVPERIVLVVTDNKPAISFQFKSATLPGSDAFDLMARASSLVTGKDAAIAMRLLRRSCTAARKKDPGVATTSANGISATCILPRDGGGVNFLVAPD